MQAYPHIKVGVLLPFRHFEIFSFLSPCYEFWGKEGKPRFLRGFLMEFIWNMWVCLVGGWGFCGLVMYLWGRVLGGDWRAREGRGFFIRDLGTCACKSHSTVRGSIVRIARFTR